MALAGELAKHIGGEIAKNTGKQLAIKGGQQVIQKASSDVLRNAITDIVAKNSIDLASKGFGKQILSSLRNKVFNSPASEAQAIVDAFPKLYRTDFGVDGNDMISTLKNDGGAVLSGFAKFDNVDTGKGTRRLGISRDSFDRFFKRPENSFLANPKMEVGGSPRTGELYPNNQLRNAEDVLSELRNRVLDYYTSDPSNEELINSIPNIYGADEYASGLLEEIAKSNSPITTINEFKMAMGPRDISAISDMNFGNTRQLINNAQLTLANGETINVPANSLFGNFDGIREQLYDAPKGMTTNGGYKYSGITLPKEALKNDPKAAIYNKLAEDYGPEKTREIMAYYGGDIGKSAKSGQNSFLGRLLTGDEVESPLVMYHGVGTDKLKEILDIAEETSNEYAIPNPSLQVINPNVNAGTSYGDVVLLGNKSIPGGINPYTGGPDYGGKYNLYSRDVYSPRKPNIEYKKGIPTISGTRKLATPQNISDYMNKQGVKAVESQWATPGSMAATQAQRLKNPLEALNNSDLIKAQEELDEIFDNWDRELDGSIKKLLDKYMEKNPDANRFSIHDYIAEELQNAMAGGQAWEGDPYGIWTDEGRKIVADLKKKAANLPTAYFEAKANRAVPLREFGGAILPEGYADERVLNALEKSGISVLGHYDPKNYQESMKSVLRSLIKDKDRFNTPYMMSVVEPDMALSPEQREFFKDSVVRDKDGNLMPVFHTTNTNKRIDVFNADNGMVWVTPNKMYSTGFAGNGYNPDRTYELYANIKNPVYVGNIDPAINDETIKKLSAYTGVDEETLLAIAEKYDARNIWKITNSKDFKELMQAKGYDGIEAREGGNQVSYAAFSPEQVKRVGNLNPTGSPMINNSVPYGGYSDFDNNVKRIGSSEVAPVREETLPDGWKELDKYLDTSNDRLSLAIGKPRSKITKQDLINFLEDYGYDTEGTKDDLWKNALMCIDDMALDDLYNAGGSAGQFLQSRLPFRHNDKLTDVTNYYIGNKGRTGRLDAEYSDRLGIGRSNTPMSDSLVNPYSGAGGDYSEGAFGTNATWATGESGVSTAAHERLHAWQDINKYDWDEEVVDAIDELREELKKYYHDVDTIKKYWGNSKTDYYSKDVEQEARMLQSYLDNEGYTNTYRKNSEKGTEWGDEIKPAFDRFFKKLRALSKKGIALPAVAGLVGIGALAGKKDDKSVDNIE